MGGEVRFAGQREGTCFFPLAVLCSVFELFLFLFPPSRWDEAVNRVLSWPRFREGFAGVEEMGYY